jgi:PIN domain nuclease of toxin-antitoxin system
MRLLLDTHAFIWWDVDPAKLSPLALTLCQNPANTLFLSLTSVWEMQIKIQLGRLQLRLPLRNTIAAQQANGIQILPITVLHIFALEGMPHHHGDPFDRMLIAQANTESMALVSRDPFFSSYSVNVMW